MDYRELAKDELKNFRLHKTALINLNEKINELNRSLKEISDTEERLSVIAERETLKEVYRFRQATVRRVERGLEQLSEVEKTVLSFFYMKPSGDAETSVYKLMELTGYERRAVYYQRDKAIKVFTMAMYGVLAI